VQAESRRHSQRTSRLRGWNYKKMTSEFGLDADHGVTTTSCAPGSFSLPGVSEFWRRQLSKTPKGNDAIYRATTRAGFVPPARRTRLKTICKPKSAGEPPTCLVHETPLDRISEESYFFRLSDYAEALLAFYEAAGFCAARIKKQRSNQLCSRGATGFVCQPVEDAVSWGCRCRTIRRTRCTFV